MRTAREIPINQTMATLFTEQIRQIKRSFVREMISIYARLQADSAVSPIDLFQFKNAIISLNESGAVDALTYDRYPSGSKIRSLLNTTYHLELDSLALTSLGAFKKRLTAAKTEFVRRYKAENPLPLASSLEMIFNDTRLIWWSVLFVLWLYPPTALIGAAGIWVACIFDVYFSCTNTVPGGYNNWITSHVVNPADVIPALNQQELDAAFSDAARLTEQFVEQQILYQSMPNNHQASSTRIPTVHAVPLNIDNNDLDDDTDENTNLMRKNRGLLSKISMLSQPPSYGATMTTVNSSSSSSTAVASSSATHSSLNATNDDSEEETDSLSLSRRHSNSG